MSPVVKKKKPVTIIGLLAVVLLIAIAVFIAVRYARKAPETVYGISDCIRMRVIYEKVLEKNPSDYAALWNLSRCCSEQALLLDNEKISEELLRKAADYARRAISLNEEGYEGHLYLAEALGILLKYEGPVDRVRLIRLVKQEAETTIQLNPNHYRAYLILGIWHVKVNKASWLEKKLANVFLGGVPESSLEEAKANFEKSIELKSDFPKSHYELARIYIGLGNKELAREELEKTLGGPFTNIKELELKETAGLLLSEMRAKE